MKPHQLFVASALLFLSSTVFAQQKPNIIYVLTDDLGYGDLGIFFQKQRQNSKSGSQPFMLTPNIDRMAEMGAVMEQYCAAPVCAPSRASLLLGVSQGHANVRDNQFDKALEDNHTLGNVMQKAGYSTAAIGKWGLQGQKSIGPNWPAGPHKRGFDYYYGYISHGDGHEHYPKEGLYRNAKKVWDNTKEISSVLDNCYTGDLFTAMAKKYITDHQKGKLASQPFFLYLAYDTPHAVLELPTMAYPTGGGLNGGLQWTGKPGAMINTATGKPDSWTHPDYVNATYDHDKDPSTAEVAWPETYKRYATVVRRIDDQVGDILKLLKDLKIENNTLVVFTSDNGPSAESYLPKPNVAYTPVFFSGNGPFDGLKRDVLEGGVRVPTIAYWPTHIKEKTKIVQPSISYDWMPTLTALAGLPAPVRSDGVSLLPALTGIGKQPESKVYVEYFNDGKTPGYKTFEPIRQNRPRNQMQMLRFGDTVGIRYDIKSHQDDFEIFNIIKDPKQANNLAGTSTKELQEKMKATVLQSRMSDSSASRPYDSELIPALKSKISANAGLIWKSYKGDYPWLAKTDDLMPADKGIINGLDISKIKSTDKLYLLQGYLNVPEDGSYTFYFTAAGKGFMRLHDIALIDADFGYKSGEERKATLQLKKGLHPVKIYYSGTKGVKSELTLKWESPAIQKQNIPSGNLVR